MEFAPAGMASRASRYLSAIPGNYLTNFLLCSLPTHPASISTYRCGEEKWQVSVVNGNAGSLGAENVKRAGICVASAIAGKKRLDQVGGKFLGANAGLLRARALRLAALPLKLDYNRHQVFRDPAIVNTHEGENIVGTGGNGADLVFTM